jgi:hypothetical protein
VDFNQIICLLLLHGNSNQIDLWVATYRAYEECGDHCPDYIVKQYAACILDTSVEAYRRRWRRFTQWVETTLGQSRRIH